MAERAEAARTREAPHHPIYGPYRGAAPFFYTTAALPWRERMEGAWKEVRQELEDGLAEGDAFRANWDPYGFAVGGWKTLNFQTYLRRYPPNCRAFPRTVTLLDSIPGLVSAYVNLLEPHTHIPLHSGDSNTIVRYHLGLRVPGGLDACGLQVGPERRGWKEGELLAFCDAHEHRAWNDTDETRAILVFDLMRPEYWEDRHRICGDVLAAIGLTWLDTRFGLRTRLPQPALRVLHRGLGAGFQAWLTLQDGGRSAARAPLVPAA